MRLKTMAFTASFLFTTVTFGNTLTGAIVYDQIVHELKQENIKSDPAIDTARQFPSCPSGLLINSIFGSWKTVEIRCPDNDWKLAVRTNAHENLQLLRQRDQKNDNKKKFVISLKTSLSKGDIIKNVHLTYLKTKKNVAGGVFYVEDDVVGRTLKQQLSVGSIVRARHLTPNWAITKNQKVMIEHKVGNIIINAQGVAQESGQIGQQIWVNNFNSGKEVLCWVKNDKKVTTNAKLY